MEHHGFLDGNDDKSFKLKASVQTYELSLADLAQLFSEKLGVPASRITITPKENVIGDPMDRYPAVHNFVGLTVTVKAG